MILKLLSKLLCSRENSQTQILPVPVLVPAVECIRKEEESKMSVLQTIQSTKWNVAAIKTCLEDYAQRIKKLKAQIRQPGHMITWSESRELTSLKDHVTKLCILQAARRGKPHIAGLELSEQIEKFLAFDICEFVDEFGLDQ